MTKHKVERSEYTRKLLSEANLSYFHRTSKDIKQLRWDKIGLKRKKCFTEDEMKRIEHIIDLRYVSNASIILNHAKVIGISKKVLENYWADKLIKRPYALFIPLNIQRFSPDEFEKFKKDSQKLDHRQMEIKYNITLKSYHSICKKFKDIRWGKIETMYNEETKPEKFVREYLDTLNIDYYREKYVNEGRYRIDFIIEDKAIEVQGDYYHANPRMFDYTKLYPIQIKNVLNDIEKKNWLLENGYKILEIWEKDIKERPDNVKHVINNYLII